MHWLRGVTDAAWVEVYHYLVSEVGLSGAVNAPALFGYQRAVRFAEGVRLCWDPRPATQEDEMPACLLDVPGDACEALGWERLQLVALLLKLTRLDVAWDAGDEVTPGKLDRLWERGCGRSRITYADWKRNREGETWTLGKQGSSTAQLQCYNRRGYNRLELRLFKGRAQLFQEAGGFVGSLEEAQQLAVSQLRRVVDFVDPDSDSNRSRQRLLPFWEAFIAGAVKSDATLPPRVPSCDASHRRWVRAIGKSLGRSLLRDGEAHLVGVAKLGAAVLLSDLPVSASCTERSAPPGRGAVSASASGLQLRA